MWARWARAGMTAAAVASRRLAVVPERRAPLPWLRQARALSTAAPDGVFVSAHFQLQPDEITAFLGRVNLEHRMRDDVVEIRSCPICRATGKSSQWQLHVNRQHGHYACDCCHSKGSWFDFKRAVQGYPISSRTAPSTSAPPATRAAPRRLTFAQLDASLDAQRGVRDWCTSANKIDSSTLALYHVGASKQLFVDKRTGAKREHLCAALPVQVAGGADDVVSRVRHVSIQDASLQHVDVLSGEATLFGLHTLRDAAVAASTQVVLTGSEWDAMAVRQATGVPAVALPAGYASLPVSALPALERFSKVLLWFSDDVAGQEAVDKFARKLGRDRCFVVRVLSPAPGQPPLPQPAPRTAHAALCAGLDLGAMVQAAIRLPHQQIQQFSALRGAVHNELREPEQAMGVRSMTLPGLARVLKGMRRGELTIVTGPTGAGKTSFLSQLSLDYCMQGVPTLWGSFEVKNMRLAKKMLGQFAGKDFTADLADFDEWADRFEQLPMHFLKFFGSTRVELALDAMEHAVYVNDVEHIVLDNLQFMTSGQGKGFERFEIQDRAIELFRAFASEKNVHITVVIHPRKEDDDAPLMTSSVFGTAKATQEADNVIILQRGRHYRYLDIKKNRFDGDLGIVPYRFEKHTGRFVELTTEEVAALQASAQGVGQHAPPRRFGSPPRRDY